VGSIYVPISIRNKRAETLAREVARAAWRRWGKGRHPAGPNIGDCAAYALARISGEPLLCKGEDFPKTDVVLSRY
jgi:ribonuclease VapC